MGRVSCLQPLEVEVYYLLPAVRRELSMALKERGLDQKSIAAFLGVTEAAVSQYVSGKRGKEVGLPQSFKDVVKNHAARIKDNKSCYAAIARLMREAHKTRVLCQIHRSVDDTIKEGCRICYCK